MTTADLPSIYTCFNAAAAVLIVCGLISAKKGKIQAHKRFMVTALGFSAAFLGCYLFYHYLHGSKSSGHMPAGVRKVYLAILIPHIILAIVNLPMIITTVVTGVRGKIAAHRAWAKFTFPIWLYVSVTGVIVYLMIYVWYPLP